MVEKGSRKRRIERQRQITIPEAELIDLKNTQIIGLVSGIIAVTVAALYTRLYPALLWGTYINEFDPYIRYYLTEFMLKLGVVKGIEWWLSGGYINGQLFINKHFWYPWGINWATTLSPGISFTGLILYDILVRKLHLDITLLSIAVYAPGIINALAVLSMYYLGSRIGGRYVGLLSALMTAFSLIFLQRGEASWYADATIFQFIAPLGMALFVEAMRRDNWAPYAILAGIVNGATVWFWGSFTFLMNAYGTFALLLSIYVLYRLYRGRVIPLAIDEGLSVSPFNAFSTYLLTYLGFAAFLAMTPRYKLHAVLGLGALATLAALVAVVVLVVLALDRLGMRRLVDVSKYVLAALVAAAVVIIVLGLFGISVLIHIPGGKYIAALLPTSRSALVQSVAEHSPSTYHQIAATVGFSLPFETLGIVSLLAPLNVAGLLLSVTSVASMYFASSEAWLTMLLFAWLPVAAYGLYVVIRFLAQQRSLAIALVVLALVIALFAESSVYMAQQSIPLAAAPQQIVSTTSPAIPSSDWLDALYWIQYNTPDNSVLASWWDYGYWLAILGNRTSLVDNSTINGTQIVQIATAFTTTNVTKALAILRDLGADYVVVFLPYYPVPLTVPSPYSSFSSVSSYFAVCGLYPEYPTGGDFVKSYWMSLISGNSASYTNTHILSAASIVFSSPTGGTETLNVYVPLSNTTIYKLMFNLEAPLYSMLVDQCLGEVKSMASQSASATVTPFPLPLWLFNTWPSYAAQSSSSVVHLLLTFQPIVGQNFVPPPFVGTNTTLLNQLYALWFYGNWASPPPGFQLVYVSRPYGWVLVYKIDYSVLNKTQ